MGAGKDAWRVWEGDAEYGALFRKCATGELSEMECSRAAARVLKPLVARDERILDVGCGAGHYLRSLAATLEVPFAYTGVDATALYIEIARKIWSGRPDTEFRTGDIFELPFPDRSFDHVLCCNVLLHLPSIAKPLSELARVARRNVVVRTLVGDRSFRVQDVYAGTPEAPEFDEKGEPRRWHYFNIYSEAYVKSCLLPLPGVTGVEISPDRDFSPERIMQAARDGGTFDATKILGEWQVNGSILEPWQFVVVRKAHN